MGIEITFPASEIATRLDSAECVSSDTKSSDARKRLMSRRFDQAPVMRDGRLIG